MKDQLLQQLNNDVFICKRFISKKDIFEEQVEIIRQYFFDRYLRKYVRASSSLSDILQGKGGNCEAQTKLFVHVFLHCGLQYPSNQTLGVQQFKDHVQPVIYNRSNGEVWELVSGKRLKSVSAPIYEPILLLHAYLLGQGVAPAVDIFDLLIIDVEDSQNNKKTGYKTDTELIFQGGKGYYNEGAIPEQAQATYQPSEQKKEIKTNNIISFLKRIFGGYHKNN